MGGTVWVCNSHTEAALGNSQEEITLVSPLVFQMLNASCLPVTDGSHPAHINDRTLAPSARWHATYFMFISVTCDTPCLGSRWSLIMTFAMCCNELTICHMFECLCVILTFHSGRLITSVHVVRIPQA